MSACTFLFANGFQPLLDYAVRSVEKKCDKIILFDMGLLQFKNNNSIQVVPGKLFSKALDENGKIQNWALLYNMSLSFLRNQGFTSAFMLDADEIYCGPDLRNYAWVDKYAAIRDRICCINNGKEVEYFSEQQVITKNEFILARFFNLNSKNYHFTRKVHPFIVDKKENLLPPFVFIPSVIMHFNVAIKGVKENINTHSWYNELDNTVTNINSELSSLGNGTRPISREKMEQISHLYGGMSLKN